MRKILVLAGAVLALVVVNGLIVQKERVLQGGVPVLLKLAPRDPRSLIQGDYMELRYEIAENVSRDDLRENGRLVIRLDENGVGGFVRMDDGRPLADGELFLVYRKRGRLRLGAESYFFQEGQAERFAQAKYALLKVTPAGNSVLAGLRGENREELPAMENRK